MNDDCLKLTVYFGERDRVDGGFVSDALGAIYARHRLRTSIVLRGVEGFGSKHALRTDRLLTLSEDLPLVSTAVDETARIERALSDVARLPLRGLVTFERARLLAPRSSPFELPPELAGGAKLTVYLGRRERIAGRPAHEAVVARMHARGIAGATVLLGVDGTADGDRRRARFFGRNAGVPVMVIAVGDGERIAALVPELEEMTGRPLITLERVRVCKRDGVHIADPPHVAEPDPDGLARWQSLMVYAGEQARHGGRPLHAALMRRLRTAGATGATSVRGIWGYHGDHAPHGDTFWQLRRRVPIVTVVIDRPARMREWFRIVDELTDETGLVTCETVPAAQARGAVEWGGLRLAARAA